MLRLKNWPAAMGQFDLWKQPKCALAKNGKGMLSGMEIKYVENNYVGVGTERMHEEHHSLANGSFPNGKQEMGNKPNGSTN